MRKNLRIIVLLICSTLLFTACQKELTFEDLPVNMPGSNGGTATYSFEGGINTCTGAIINGKYNKGAVLDSSNTITIKLKVDSLGTYTIATANINGIIFSGSGTFTTTGVQSITLKGAGTPLAPGSFTFTPGAAGCTFAITFTANGVTAGTALFILNGAPDSCTTPIVSGIYMKGVPLDASDSVVIKATVATPGNYTITSNTANGMIFSASGNFTTAGQHTVTLKGSGKPTEIGGAVFIPGTNGCQFAIATIAAPVAANCKECSYIPICVGIKYNYIEVNFIPSFADTGYNAIEAKRYVELISSVDTVIKGRPYKKMGSFDGNGIGYSYLNCTNGETSVLNYASESTTSGSVLTAYNSIELKANAPEGTSWSDTSTLNGDSKVYGVHTITQKGFSKDVFGVNFNDVIKVTVKRSISVQGATPQDAGTTIYFFANGVGIIQVLTYFPNPVTNEVYLAYSSSLETYTIP